jgi:hypothetical protein
MFFSLFPIEVWLELKILDVNQGGHRWSPKTLNAESKIKEFESRLEEATKCFMVRTLDTIRTNSYIICLASCYR